MFRVGDKVRVIKDIYIPNYQYRKFIIVEYDNNIGVYVLRDATSASICRWLAEKSDLERIELGEWA